MLQGGIEGGTGRIILSNIAMFSDGEPAQFESHPRSHIKLKKQVADFPTGIGWADFY